MFFVSTRARGAHPLLTLHYGSWLWQQELTHSIPSALEDMPGASCPFSPQRRGCPLLLVSHTQGRGSLHGPSVCRQDHSSLAQFPELSHWAHVAQR